MSYQSDHWQSTGSRWWVRSRFLHVFFQRCYQDYFTNGNLLLLLTGNTVIYKIKLIHHPHKIDTLKRTILHSYIPIFCHIPTKWVQFSTGVRVVCAWLPETRQNYNIPLTLKAYIWRILNVKVHFYGILKYFGKVNTHTREIIYSLL